MTAFLVKLSISWYANVVYFALANSALYYSCGGAAAVFIVWLLFAEYFKIVSFDGAVQVMLVLAVQTMCYKAILPVLSVL